MILYIPASYNEADYTPSWTGNYAYPTVTIRGIFDSEEKALSAVRGWNKADDYVMETFYGHKIEKSYRIDYEDKILRVIGLNDKSGDYQINTIVDEPYSEVYDEDGDLGVFDW